MWVELNMKIATNLLISLIAFFIAISIAIATGIELVFNAVFLAFAIQWIAFIPAYIFQTEKFYDLTGSLTYLLVIWYSLTLSSDQFTNLNGANIVIVLLISLWAIRLGSFLFMRIHHDGEDKRFRSIKPSASQFFMTWTLQGLWVSLCSMCALTAISSNTGIVTNAFFYIGLALFILGFTIEVMADMEKSAFKAIQENKDKFITTGLWARSRHPNYFGEIVLRCGIFLLCCRSFSGIMWFSFLSPVFVAVMLIKVTGVPGHDKRALHLWASDPEYMQYRRRTSLIIPLPPRDVSHTRRAPASSMDSDGENRPLVILRHKTTYSAVPTEDFEELPVLSDDDDDDDDDGGALGEQQSLGSLELLGRG